MADFNQILTPGNIADGLVNTVVEIPEGSILKIEWDRKRAAFMLDRVEPGIFTKPVSYGFIPQTLDDDGDELDTLIVCDEPLPTGIWLEAKILGVMNFEDDGDMDHKIVVRAADDRNDGDWLNTLEDLGDLWKQMIEHHFNHYKDLKKPGSTKVLGWGDTAEAQAIINECIERYKKEA
ncbi:MAG TPA: inorganic diphosphatase [Candidatus Saccharimonadales bacterium]|nr:inorganic diphosphatase [Candidatus Saccharimonadales bacterium]